MTSLPGLPGLSLSAAPEPVSQAPTTRIQDLPAGSEYRFEVAFSQTLRVKLVRGTAELFGAELAPNSKDPYTFSGTKAAIYTWHGCLLELSGEAESEYVAEETQMMSYANAHFALENVRDTAASTRQIGPRILVLGPENAGKTSVVKILTGYAVKSARQPVVVNLDPRQGLLSVPGSFTATTFSSIVDMEEGWGSSPISGPSPVPVKMPLVYHYGLASPEEGKLFKPLVTRMALAVTSRLEADKETKPSGCIIDTPGALSQGKGGHYDNIEHIISEFSVNVVLVIGSERLYSDLSRKYSNRPADEAVSVIKLDKSGGCVDRDESYMKQFRQAQIRSYFFGHTNSALSPSTHFADYGELTIYKIADADANAAYLPGGGDDDDDEVYGPRTKSIYERLEPSSMLQNQLVAITTAGANDSQETIRDSSVLGYIYVADVDESKKKVRLLAPQSGRTPPNAMIVGSFPEDVVGLIS